MHTHNCCSVPGTVQVLWGLPPASSSAAEPPGIPHPCPPICSPAGLQSGLCFLLRKSFLSFVCINCNCLFRSYFWKAAWPSGLRYNLLVSSLRAGLVRSGGMGHGAGVDSLSSWRTNSETYASVLSRWCSRKVRDLWWQGIPPSVRGKVWSLAIGNELNITHGEWLV
jgi:hypothetical protein